MTFRLVPDSTVLAHLEELWERALPELGAALPAAWGPALRALSNRFNRIEGAPQGDYFGPENLAPYFAHHGWAQAVSLAAIAAETPAAFSDVREVWDLGGGPGVLTLAASALLPEAHFTLTDLRAEALQWAETHLKPLRLHTRRQRLPDLPDGKPDLVLLGHVLNELESGAQEELLRRLKERLAPGGTILILEPALREPTRRLMHLRGLFLEPPFAIAAPCPCPGPCPMLTLERQWCVAERPWDPPSWFKALDAAAGLDRHHLTFAYLVAGRNVGAKAPTARVVGVPKAQKGKVERWMCTPTGGERWEALTRHGEPDWALPRTAEVPLPLEEGPPKPLPDGWKLRRRAPQS